MDRSIAGNNDFAAVIAVVQIFCVDYADFDFILKEAADNSFICVNRNNTAVSNAGFGNCFLRFAILRDYGLPRNSAIKAFT